MNKTACYALLACATCLMAVNVFIKHHDHLNAYTMGGLFGVFLVPFIGYATILSILALAVSFLVRRNKSIFLVTFTWLFFLSAFFDTAVGAFTKLYLEPKIANSVLNNVEQSESESAIEERFYKHYREVPNQ